MRETRTCRSDSSRLSHVVRYTGSTCRCTRRTLVDVTISIRFAPLCDPEKRTGGGGGGYRSCANSVASNERRTFNNTTSEQEIKRAQDVNLFRPREGKKAKRSMYACNL